MTLSPIIQVVHATLHLLQDQLELSAKVTIIQLLGGGGGGGREPGVFKLDTLFISLPAELNIFHTLPQVKYFFHLECSIYNIGSPIRPSVREASQI